MMPVLNFFSESGLAAIELGSAWMLGWLAAAGIPLALHLLHRRRQQEVSWAAMELLLHAIQQNSRTIRIEGWLLLLLRTLALVLLAIALARPLFTGSTQDSIVSTQPPRLWVLVLDASYSMGYTPSRQSLWQQAQSAANDIVGQAGVNDGFLLIQMAEPSQPIVSQPAFDAQRVLGEIGRLKCTDGGGDLSSCLAVLRQTIEDAGPSIANNSDVHIVFLTDMGSDTWQAATQEPLKRELQELSNKYHVSIQSLAPQSPQNLAITSLEADSPIVWRGRPLRCSATIHNYSTTAATRLPVQFQSEGSTLQTEFIDCPPGQSRSVNVELQPSNRAVWSISAVLPEDRLMVDNRRDLVIAVKPQVRVVTVEDGSGSSRWINLSLAPGATEAKSMANNRAMAVETWNSFDLQSRSLSDIGAVILIDLAEVSPAVVGKLQSYVDAGGCLFLLAGPRTQAGAWNQGESSLSQLTGVRLQETSATGDWHIDPLNYASPIARPFANYLDSGLLTTPIFRYWKTTPIEASAGSVTIDLGLDSGDPFLLRRSVGEGWVAVMLSAPQTGSNTTDEAMNWNAMATWPSFVPIMQKTMETLIGGSEGQFNLMVGQPLRGSTTSLSQSLELIVDRPDGLQNRLTVPATNRGNRRNWTYAATDRAGIYKVELKGERSSATDDKQPLSQAGDRPIAVNIYPDQSELLSLPVAAIALADGPQSSPQADRATARGEQVRPDEWLAQVCLWALMATLVCESLLAWHLGRRLA